MVTLWATVFRERPAMKPVRPLRAPLERPRMSIGAFTAPDVMFTIRPNLRSIMPSTVALIKSIGVSMLASRAAIQILRSHWRKSPGGGPPALLMRISGAGQAARAAARPSSVVISAATAVTRAPVARRISSAVASRVWAVRATMVTFRSFARQREGARFTEAFAGSANQRVFSCDFQVHNVMMRFLLFLLPLLAYGENLTGLWDATVITDGVHVPFRMKLTQKGSIAQGTLYDGRIEYKSDAGKFEGGKLHLHWNITNADLDAAFDGKELKGKYVTRRSHTKLLTKDVIARRTAVPAIENAKAVSVAGRWTIKSNDNDPKKVWSITIQQLGLGAGGLSRGD